MKLSFTPRKDSNSKIRFSSLAVNNSFNNSSFSTFTLTAAGRLGVFSPNDQKGHEGFILKKILLF